jgi:DNA-binding transcriptional MerR regulator
MSDASIPPSEPLVPKAYYSIGEVCDLTGLKPHVLRYWETQFEAIHPTKNRAGNRVYRPREVELILLVKHLLYEEKFTIEGARKRLKEMRGEGVLAEERQEVAGPELYQVMKEELHALRRVLTVPEGPLSGGATTAVAGADAPPARRDAPDAEDAGNPGLRPNEDPPGQGGGGGRREGDPYPQLHLDVDGG